MPKHWLLLLIISLFTVPLAAQDEYTPYIIALQRIEEARVSGATNLNLSDLDITELPPELWQLTQLRSLSLLGIGSESLPSEIGQLTELRVLDLKYNGFTSLPPELCQLTQLKYLNLVGNPIGSLPPEIGQLRNLCYLGLSYDKLQHLPNELGNILAPSETCPEPRLDIDNNFLITPPPEVIAQGTPAILEYLRNQAAYHTQQLMAGAAGGVGVIAGVILLARWRYRRLRKPKAKRGE